MIIKRDNYLRILTLGLTLEEQKQLYEIAAQTNCIIYQADSEIELWKQTCDLEFDLFVLGQSDSLPYPSFRIWLIRGINSNAHITVIFNNLSSIELEPLNNCPKITILERPADISVMQSTLEDIECSQSPVREERAPKSKTLRIHNSSSTSKPE